MQIQAADRISDLHQLLTGNESDIVYDSGFSKSIIRVTLSDIPDIVKTVCHYNTVFAMKPQLDQLSEGLKLHGVHELIKMYPAQMKNLFVLNHSQEALNADDFIALFSTNFSPSASTKRALEESIYMNWVEFVQDVANGLVGMTKYIVHVASC